MTSAVIPAAVAIAEIIRRSSPAAFKVLDALCDQLVIADPDSRAVQAFQTACAIRKATRRRKRR